MRVLVAGRNAKVLAEAAGTFAVDLQIHTAASKAACFTLLQRIEFDLIVACETLADGSGLEVLSHVAVNTPNTLRIFAARPATLDLLKGELGLFGLFRTLPYPINFRKLWAAISLARGACSDEPADAPMDSITVTGRVEVATPTGAAPAPSAPARSRTQQSTRQVAPGPTHVTAPAPQRQATAAAARGRTQQPARQAEQPPRQKQSAPQRNEITSGMRAAARYAAAHAGRDPGAVSSRIPETDAFKRARARRDSGRVEPVVSNESLAQLAKLAAKGRPTPTFRTVPTIKKRAAFFVGSGVFAAATVAVLTFFMVSPNNASQRSKLPMIASLAQPVPNKVFPWQPETQQPRQQPAFMRSEASASAVANIEAEAEAASESSDGEPGHPGPPPPYAPPPPSEPPSLESPEQPTDP